MSLINEALKKAQRQRNLDATPTASAPSGIAAAAVTTHVRAASHRSSNAPLWFGLGLLLLGGVVTAVVILFVLNPAPAPATIATATQPAATTTVAATTPKPPAPTPLPLPVPEVALPTITVPSMSAPVAATAAPASSPAPAPAPSVVIAPPAPPPAAPVPATAAVTTSKPAPEPARTVAAAPSVPAPAAPVPVTRVTVTPEAKVYAFLDKLRITGVRGVGIDARVLMNEKVYRINDMVDRELGLRLVEVSSSLLVFVDASGLKYQKPL